MRKIFIILLVFSFTSGSAQFQSDDTHISGKFSYGQQGPARYNLYAVQMDLFLNDHISVNYNFDLIYTTDNVRYFHTPLGIIGGPPLIILGLLSSNNSSSDLDLGGGGALLGLILLIAPDGIAAHIPIGSHLDISPYANILGLDFIRDRTIYESWIKYSASFGAQLTYLHKSDFTFSLYAEMRKAIRFPWMQGIGFSVGYKF